MSGIEKPNKPDRYTDEEWEELKDLAEPDIEIPYEEFVSVMRATLADITRFARRLQVDVPDVANILIAQSDEALLQLQASRNITYLELQLWRGDAKIDIFDRSRRLTD